MKNRVAIYARLSEEDRDKKNKSDDSESIQNQKSLMLKYAADHGWEVYNIYSDDDYAGADRNRPAFRQLIADAEARKFNIILCKSQARFTRELELVEKYINGLFITWGIRFVSIADNADTDNKGNKKSRQINGLVNEWYIEDMSENIKSVLTNKRENGLHIGAFALYGYKKDPDRKGHLIIDEPAANVVREVFNLYSEGYGKTYIARLLNERKIPNPTEYKRLQGLRTKSTSKNPNNALWRYSTISYMLQNEMYIGNMVQGKYGSISYKTKENRPLPKDQWIRVENTHEPIISKDLWDRVHSLMSQRTKPFSDTNKIGLFSGKVKCLYCGYTMRTHKATDANGGHRMYQCATRYVSKDACKGVIISAATLEKHVFERIKEFNEKLLDRDALENGISVGDELKQQTDSLKAELPKVEKRLANNEQCLRNIYIDKVRGIITEEEFRAYTDTFTSERKALLLRIKEIQKAIGEIEEKRGFIIDRHALAEKYVNTTELTRDMVDTLIDYIVVGGTRKNRFIQIHWMF